MPILSIVLAKNNMIVEVASHRLPRQFGFGKEIKKLRFGLKTISAIMFELN